MKKIAEMVNNAVAEAQAAQAETSATKTPVKETPKSQEKKDDKAQKAKVNVEANVMLIMSNLPNEVTPKHIDEAFKFNDGGKTVRRHLRKKFGDNHEHKADWKWAKNDPVLKVILAYFAERYEIPAPTKKAQ